MEKLLYFIEELIKKRKGEKYSEDYLAFQELCEGDQERVNELLAKEGINYHSNTISSTKTGGSGGGLASFF